MLLKLLALGWVFLIAVGFAVKWTIGGVLLLFTIAVLVLAGIWVVVRLFVLPDADELVEEEYEEHFQNRVDPT